MSFNRVTTNQPIGTPPQAQPTIIQRALHLMSNLPKELRRPNKDLVQINTGNLLKRKVAPLSKDTTSNRPQKKSRSDCLNERSDCLIENLLTTELIQKIILHTDQKDLQSTMLVSKYWHNQSIVVAENKLVAPLIRIFNALTNNTNQEILENKNIQEKYSYLKKEIIQKINSISFSKLAKLLEQIEFSPYFAADLDVLGKMYGDDKSPVDKNHKNQILIYFGKLLLTRGKINEANEISKGMTCHDKYYLQLEVIKAFLKKGDIAQANNVIQTVSNPTYAHYLMVKRYVKDGNFTMALNIANSNSFEYNKEKSLKYISIYESFHYVKTHGSYPNDIDPYLKPLVQILEGKYIEARENAKSLTDADRRSGVFEEMAMLCLKKENYHMAINIARQENDEELIADVFERKIHKLLKDNNFQEAIPLALFMPDVDDQKDQILWEIASKLMNFGYFDLALNIIKEIPEDYDNFKTCKKDALLELCKKLAKQGKFQDAIKVAKDEIIHANTRLKAIDYIEKIAKKFQSENGESTFLPS